MLGVTFLLSVTAAWGLSNMVPPIMKIGSHDLFPYKEIDVQLPEFVMSYGAPLVTDGDFQSYIEQEQPALLMFCERWYGSCDAYKGILNSAARSSGVRNGIVVLDHSPKLAASYSFGGQAAFIWFQKGKQERFYGPSELGELSVFVSAMKEKGTSSSEYAGFDPVGEIDASTLPKYARSGKMLVWFILDRVDKNFLSIVKDKLVPELAKNFGDTTLVAYTEYSKMGWVPKRLYLMDGGNFVIVQKDSNDPSKREIVTITPVMTVDIINRIITGVRTALTGSPRKHSLKGEWLVAARKDPGRVTKAVAPTVVVDVLEEQRAVVFYACSDLVKRCRDFELEFRALGEVLVHEFQEFATVVTIDGWRNDSPDPRINWDILPTLALRRPDRPALQYYTGPWEINSVIVWLADQHEDIPELIQKFFSLTAHPVILRATGQAPPVEQRPPGPGQAPPNQGPPDGRGPHGGGPPPQ